MKISEDLTSPFLPEGPVRLVILGTMVAICARTIDGKKPTEETFYYHNPRNHFWKVLQYTFNPDQEAKKLSLPEKRSFLNENGIGIINLVKKIEVPNSEAHDPSDTILFKANKKDRIEFRKISKKLKETLKISPCVFTCREKVGISRLINGFTNTNEIKNWGVSNIHFLATPTRCNPQARGKMWRQELETYFKHLNLDSCFKEVQGARLRKVPGSV